MTEIKPLQQHAQRDCSLLAVMNCAKLNNPEFDSKFTQVFADKLMPEYEAKSPVEAFYFLKQRGFMLRQIGLSVAGARARLGKGSAVVCRRKYNRNYWIDLKDDWEANGSKPIDIDTEKSGHFFVLKKEGDKVWAYDSNFPHRYLIDWEFFHREGVIGVTYYQVK